MYMPFHASLLLLSLVLVVGCLTATSSASSLYANARKNLIESNSTAIKASDNDVLLTFINEYDPAVDGGHDAVHWSVREDGLYKSYDKEKWVLTKTWRNDNCG
ncbi:hypothetical protein AHAS_Ahas09G0276200 [Arachis hypogaea]